MRYEANNLYAVIMAGGRGERFWPAGRRDRPKQFLPLLSPQSLLEDTVQRLFPLFAPERVLVITNHAYAARVRELLPSLPADNVIGEPEGRDTAPCVALATAILLRRDPDATMVLLPADHAIRPAQVFQNCLLAAAGQAQTGALVTLGITPTYPATGYGYIHLGDEAGDGFHKVQEFREKPDLETAVAFVKDGHYRWNSGMFIWRADAIAAAFDRYAPALGQKLQCWAAGDDYTSDFASCDKISIDYAIMEKADTVLVGDAPFAWNDVGSWSALRTVLPLDDQRNAIKGKVLAIHSAGNVLISDDDTLLGVIGMNDIVVVKAGNGILVCPLAEEQRVKELVREIQQAMPPHS